MVRSKASMKCPEKDCSLKLTRIETYPYGKKRGARVSYKCKLHGWFSKNQVAKLELKTKPSNLVEGEDEKIVIRLDLFMNEVGIQSICDDTVQSSVWVKKDDFAQFVDELREFNFQLEEKE